MKTTSAVVTSTGMYDVAAGFGVPHITAIDRVIEALLAPNSMKGWMPSRHRRRHAGGVEATAATPAGVARRTTHVDLPPTHRTPS